MSYNPVLDTSPLQWEFRAWEGDVKRRVVALIAMLAAGLAGLYVLGHPLFALLGIAVIFVSTAELFLPVKFRIDGNEARQACGISVTAIKWADVKRLIPQDDGVRLSPFDEQNRLDAFRGVYLRYAGNKDEVLGKIAELWKSDASALAGRIDDRAGNGSDREGGGGHSQTKIGDSSDSVL